MYLEKKANILAMAFKEGGKGTEGWRGAQKERMEKSSCEKPMHIL
jgi:hypothetical protein